MLAPDLILALIFALIPLQLNKFFWPDSAYVAGIPIDYLAPTIYATDFLIVLYIAISFIGVKQIVKFVKIRRLFFTALFILNIYTFLETLLISSSPSAYFKQAKTLEFSLLVLFAANTLSKKGYLEKIGRYLKVPLLVECAIIIIQFVLQRSIGLKFLGERSFDTTTTSISHFSNFGTQFLRPYGTFPHPNVAAAFMVIGLIIISTGSIDFRGVVVKIVTALSLLVTYSKSAAITVTTSVFILYPRVRILIAILSLFLIITYFIKGIPEYTLPTIAERLILSQAALDISSKHLLLGVGPANFIPTLAKLNLFSVSEVRLLQPVHNIFLLTLAENGLIGLGTIALLFFSLIKYLKSRKNQALFAFLLVFASFDHFFVTLHQGQEIFWLSIAIILSSQNKHRS